jgi:hypothetical protein
MKKHLIAVAVLLVCSSCQEPKHAAASLDRQSPSSVLAAYFDAVDRADTTLTLELSTDARAKELRTRLGSYFAQLSHKGREHKIIEEKIVSPQEAVVTYELGGERAECVLIKLDSVWEVSRCRMPGEV